MLKHPSLQHAPSDLIGGRAAALSGEGVRSHNPARPAETIWSGSPVAGHIDEAVASARTALEKWARTPVAQRLEVLRGYQRLIKSREQAIADLICDEAGKAMWEAKQEASLLAAKVDVTLDDSATGAFRRVSGYDLALGDGRVGRCSFRPHGVMAVLGPFNFPAHLPNGHIVPALATGNTVVFKPSDKTPAVGQLLGEILIEALRAAGAPDGVVNVVQGGADIAARLVRHEGVDGILFTGSWPVGRRILEANLDTPGRIVALEMGGNNAAVVMDDADLRQAVIECARASFATAGQRCTCTRRILVHQQIAERFIRALREAARGLVVGDPRSAGPVFMGPVIRAEARDAAAAFFGAAVRAGAKPVLEPTTPRDVAGAAGGHFITPGILRVEGFSKSEDVSRDAGCDVEVFGPIVRVSIVRSFEEAIEQTNATRFGLAASIFTRRREDTERFLAEAAAGCVNVNTGTAGASGKLPFGGIGLSGNHRPAGAFSLDYCAYPVASMIEQGGSAPLSPGMRFDNAWLR